MQKILVLGAGRSSSILIQFLLDKSAEWDTVITVGDRLIESAQKRIANHDRGIAIQFDASNDQLKAKTIAGNNIVISLLPPDLHILVAKECIKQRKHLVTASYVSPEMQLLNEDVKKAGLLFMCEMGLDPGIDHMSAMKIIHRIHDEGGKMVSFKSGTGGLIAPDSDKNPWHYKVTWNPRNVVLAGQGVAHYLQNGTQKLVPYHRLFLTTEKFKIKGFGKFEAYPNRDSLQYISRYGLDGIKTIIRSTLRKEGFCEAWNGLIQLGLTDDSYIIENSSSLTYSQWIAMYLPDKKKRKDQPLKDRVAKFFDRRKKHEMMERLEWLGLFSDEMIMVENGTPAQILQNLIELKWMMQPNDNDLVVMRHEFEWTPVEAGIQTSISESSTPTPKLQPPTNKLISTLTLKGQDSVNTAMAKSVGLPMAIMTKLLLKQEIFLTGVHIPVMSQVYEPVMKELKQLGIQFEEELIKPAER